MQFLKEGKTILQTRFVTITLQLRRENYRKEILLKTK